MYILFVLRDILQNPGGLLRHRPGRVHVKPDPMIEYKEFFQTLNVLPEGLE